MVDDLKIFLDDESLETILYGEGNSPPTLANIYLSSVTLFQQLSDAYYNRDWPVVDDVVKQLCDDETFLSLNQYHSIFAIISRIVPECPKPFPVDFDASRVLDLLEKGWEFAIHNSNMLLQHMIGPPMVRLYEYLGHYKEAGMYAQSLLTFNRMEEDRRGEASALNNLGFTFLLQGRWSEALPYFKQSSEIYGELDIEVNQANALCNYWQCRIELGDWGNLDETRSILEALIPKMSCYLEWYERKPLYLMARLEEHLGNYRAAIRLLVRAIRSARQSGTTYPEEDKLYLRSLWGKRRIDGYIHRDH